MNVHKSCNKIILNIYIHINNTNILNLQLFIFYIYCTFFPPLLTLNSRHFGDQMCPTFKGFTVF